MIEEEVGRDRQLHPKEPSRDWLDASGQLDAGELMDQSVESLAHSRQLDELSQVSWLQVVVPTYGRKQRKKNGKKEKSKHPLRIKSKIDTVV